MDWLLLLKALFLGIVEGLTEFLPISSTGHLILVSDLLDFNDEKGKVFAIVIQLGAILAVCWEYRVKIGGVMKNIGSHEDANRFVLNLFIAFLPAAILGLLFIKTIKQYLFHPVPVAMAFIIGGVLILWAERRKHVVDVERVEDMDWKHALKVGLMQCLALIPGTSRSGATIIGGLFFGLPARPPPSFLFSWRSPSCSQPPFMMFTNIATFFISMMLAYSLSVSSPRSSARYWQYGDYCVLSAITISPYLHGTVLDLGSLCWHGLFRAG